VSAIKKAAEPQVKRMNLNVPIELHNAFKAATASQGVNMTDTLMEFIEQYVARHGQGAKQPKGRRQ
jgi:predicted DNA binding CopG/RHH family protein